jgi:hypothetical protein
MARTPKYSLWSLDHESVSSVRALKVKDTNSAKEVEKFQREHTFGGASYYREEDEVNAEYLQLFND